VAISKNGMYWQMLKSLSDDVKLELITFLCDSMKTNKKTKTVSASRFYGVWKDDDSLDADKMIAEIKASRVFKDDVIAF